MEPKRSALTIAVPGTCGELVQGWSAAWNEAVLVSCPITLYSRVTVELRPGPEILSPHPSCDYPKVRHAARQLLDYLGHPDLGAKVYLSSHLKPGRGMASSTADVVGVMVGLAMLLGYPISPGELARLACQVEPSDSTMFAGLTMLAYRDSGQYLELGPVPSLPLLMLDTEQAVDTLTYNAQLDLSAVSKLSPTTEAAVEMLKSGLDQHDVEMIGAAASLSAFSYQVINYNPLIEQAAQWATETGAVGLVRAHSGSVVGLLYAAETELDGPGRWLSSRFSGRIQKTRLTRGSYLLADEQLVSRLMEVSPAL